MEGGRGQRRAGGGGEPTTTASGIKLEVTVREAMSKKSKVVYLLQIVYSLFSRCTWLDLAP